MQDDLAHELADLRRRVRRGEAAEDGRLCFNEYLYCLDAGHVGELVDLFADDARLDVMNFPPGSGHDLQYTTRDDIRALYERFAGEGARHHAANVSIVVDEAGDRSELSAYFHTVVEHALTGGIYELSLERRGDAWKIVTMRISSTWGWGVAHSDPPFLSERFAAGTLREGRPPRRDDVS